MFCEGTLVSMGNVQILASVPAGYMDRTNGTITRVVHMGVKQPPYWPPDIS